MNQYDVLANQAKQAGYGGVDQIQPVIGTNNALKGRSSNFFSLGNLGSTASKIVHATPGAVAGLFTQGTQAAANAIAGTASANQRADIANQTSQNIQSFHERVLKDYAAGKINKARRDSLLKDITNAQQQTAQSVAQVGQEVGTYASRAKAGLQVGTTIASLAAPELIAAKGGLITKVAGKVASKLTLGDKGGLISRALSAGLNADFAGNATEHVAQKKYGAIAGDVASVVVPHALVKYGGKALEAIGNKTFGIRSFIDEIPTKGKTIGEYVTSKAGNDSADIAKVFQKYNLDQTGGDVRSAIRKYVDWVGGEKVSAKFTAKQHLQKFKEFTQDVEKVREAAQTGLIARPGGGKWTKKEIANLWVGRFNQTDQSALIQAVKNTSSKSERIAAVQSLATTSDWGKNEYLLNKIYKAAESDDAARQIGKIQGTFSLTDQKTPLMKVLGKGAEGLIPVQEPTNIPKDFIPNTVKGVRPEQQAIDLSLTSGHIPILRKNVKTEFTAADKAGDLIRGQEPGKLLGKVGEGLRKLGLSPEPTDTRSLQAAVKTNFGKELSKVDANLGHSSNEIYKALIERARQTRGVTDIRLLSNRTIGQVIDEFGGSAKAGDVKKALAEAYLKVPTSLQGAGSKLTSGAIRYVPGEKTLLKAQSYGRFALNPFFAGKVISKSMYLGMLESNGGNVLGSVSDDVAKYVGKSKGFAGIAEDVLGNPGATASGPFKVDKIQQNIAGNLVQNILKKNGAKLSEIADNPALKQQVDHAVQMIYGYPKGGFLSSNLAKSLNVAVFPARFEAKVLGATTKAILHQPPVTRAAILNGLVRGSAWLNSPEGEKWKKDNSEFHDIVKYFTPADTIAKVLAIVTGQKKDATIKDLGAIGGLPFGVITEVLSHQGVPLGPFKSSPYKPTKTGIEVPERIPLTLKAKAATALSDVITQMFSYPGALVGLPSKAETVRKIIDIGGGGKLNAKKSEFSNTETSKPVDRSLEVKPRINIPNKLRIKDFPVGPTSAQRRSSAPPRLKRTKVVAPQNRLR